MKSYMILFIKNFSNIILSIFFWLKLAIYYTIYFNNEFGWGWEKYLSTIFKNKVIIIN